MTIVPGDANSGRPETATPRTAAECDAFGASVHYARSRDRGSPPERSYAEALPAARREILFRFVRGIMRGSPAGLCDPQFVSASSPSVPDAPVPLSDLDGPRLLAAVGPLADDCQRLALLPFPAAGSVVVAQVANVHGYDRARLCGSVRRWNCGEEDAATVRHPVDLVPLVECAGAFADTRQAERVRGELAESVANLALARLAERIHAEAVDAEGLTAETVDAEEIDAAAAPRPGAAGRSILDAVADGIPAADPVAAFERITTDGHPFHYGGKIRRGMTAADGLAYAPEFTERIDLRFVAVDRAYARETRAADAERFSSRILAAFGGLRDALGNQLPSGRDPGEYAVVPVHPWQYARTIPDRYAEQRRDGRVVPISEFSHPATPGLNLRTVVPYDTERIDGGPPPHVKLAIAVQTTNVERTLSPHAVTNGPQVTDLLSDVAGAESFETLGFLDELSATCYFAPGGPHLDGDQFDDARHLSGLLRANPYDHPLVGDGAHPVVASSLVADSPATGRPLVCDLLDEYASATETTDPTDAALSFVADYASVVVPEQVFLLSKYGIALESHLQNSLVAFDGPRPVATLVRDFGGIRVHRGRIADRGRSIDPYPESDLDADGETDLYRKLYYALFQNHLAELVAVIATELDVDEGACWARIRAACEHGFDAARSDPAVADERVRRDERALFADPTVHKALTAMRLRGKRHEYVTSEVSNPLVGAKPRSE
nr:IucA/IucC family protein [Halostella pelagica]